MGKTTDLSLWTKDLKTNIYPQLTEDIETDVLIIGGGVSGALSAFIFSEQNIDTVLIERSTIANDWTKSSTSLLHYEIDTDLKKLISLIDKRRALEAFKLTLDAVYKLDDITNKLEDKCEYVRRPSFYYSNKQEDYDYIFSEFQVRKENNFDVDFIDGQKDKDKYSFPFYAGILSYNSGAEINPVKLTNECLKYSHKKNMRIYEQTEAFEFDLDNEVKIITKKGNKIKCKKVIMASGYDSLLFFDKPFYTMARTFVLATKPVNRFDGWFNRSLIRNAEKPNIYIRTTKDNRIIIGGEDIDISIDNKNLSNDIANDKYKLLETKLENMFPLIQNKEIEYKFNNLIIESEDGLPYIGCHEEYPNIYFNIGIGSNSLMYGLIGSMLLLNKYIGVDDKRMDLFKFNR